MNEQLQKVAAAVIAALVGTIVGWSAQTFAIQGRVEAIEQGQHRLEMLMLKVIARDSKE